MKNRIFALLIALTVLVCFAAVTVSATETDTISQCECGGTAVGKYNHTCSSIDFLPWSTATELPTSGNYYLTTDVTTSAQTVISSTLRLDLNGHNITHKVTDAKESRVFSIWGAGTLSITDSTDKPGTVSRDLSLLDEATQNGITNWGLIFLIANDSTATGAVNATGSLNLYNGIFNATGQHSGGGSIISNGGLNFTVNIYGGELKGGISGSTTSASAAGAIYSVGHVNMFGGRLSGGLVYNTNYAPGGIRITVTTGQGRYLTLSGDAVICDNYRTTDGTDRYDANVQVRWGQLYMKGNFTGCASFTYMDSYQVVVPDPLTATQPLFYNGGANVNTFDISDGAILIDNQPNQGGMAKSGQIWATTTKNQCECGGTAEGKYGHTCKTLNFLPWTSTTSLPSDGNYYLTGTVTTTARKDFSAGSTVRIDLCGNDIIRSVTSTNSTSSIFGMTSSGVSSLIITDSTSTPGTVTRDLSTLDAATQASIRNYGLLMFVQNITGGGMTIYNGIYDLDGAYCDSSSVIYNSSASSTFNLYGGEIRCGITPTAKDGAIYSAGPVGLYGGKITGGKSVAANTAAVKLAKNSNFLTISGDVVVTGNCLVSIAADGTITAKEASNIFVNPDQLKFVGTFTGNVGISPVSSSKLTTPTMGMQIGISDNAVISGTVTVDGYKEYTAKVSGDKVVLASSYSAITDHGMNTYYYDTLAEALADYPGGQAVIRLMNDISEAVVIDQNVYLDLNGCDISSVTVNDGITFYVYDAMTKDFTVEDGYGYGKIAQISGSGEVTALPGGTAISSNGYMKIVENDGTSFHCYTLQTTAMTLRASCVGIYYQSHFGGDEVIKRNVTAYGVAMGAGIQPNFEDNTYTRFTDLSTWKTGVDADGNPNTVTNGTLLKDIMSTDNEAPVNKKYAKKQIYTVPYMELTDGTVIKGSTIHYSLKNLMEGYESFTGVDLLWDTLSEEQQPPVITMYETYETVVKTWNTPRISATVFGTEIPDTPYEDDGVLKILLIGHSLGLDSGYFFPEVYKEETGKDVVLGMLYHSGCPLHEHVYHLSNNLKQYAYYEYDTRKDTVWRRASSNGSFSLVYPGTANDTAIADGSIGVTMQYGIKRADWDVVVMQAGVWEAAGKGSNATTAAISANIKTIQDYVLLQDIEKRSTPEFAWNITWSAPSKESGLLNDSYTNSFTSYFNCDPTAMYNAISSTVQDAILPVCDWKYVFPSGTALHNGKTVMADTELYRDTIHASDFSRLMIAYTWLCTIEGTSIDDYNITSIYSQLRHSASDRASNIDYTLTDAQKANLKQFVKDALKNPYEITVN